MDAQQWWIIAGTSVVGIGLGGLILTQTSWWKVRMYAMKIKKTFDRHQVQEKAQALQALGQNPNPVLAKKPLRELITAYQSLVADLEKVKAPAKAAEIHEATLVMHRESLQLYQMVAIGGFRQKAMIDKQKKLQQMERGLTAKMEKIYGPMPKPGEDAPGLMGKVAGWFARRAKR